MGIIDAIKNKAKSIKDNHAIKKAFEADRRSIEIIVLKGNMPVVKSIFDESNSMFFVLDDKTTNVGDIMVTAREKKYRINDVKPSQLVLSIGGESEQVDVIAFAVEEYLNDPLSFVNNIQLSQSSDTKITINIENMSQSQISNFGNIMNQIDFTQDIETKWIKLKHDLNSRFHYKDYQKYIESVDETIREKKNLIKWEIAEKAAKVAGTFLGEIIRGFTAALLDKYGN